ncbi:MAG: sorting protein [Massilia sp.]|nr:sorting protein [Massilia sp.]
MIKWKSFLAAALLGACAQAHAVPTLSVVATPDPALVGSQVDLSVLVSDISDLYTYQFTLTFDPGLLRVTTVTEGAFLGSAGTTFGDTGSIDNTNGTISFLFNTLIGQVPGASGSGSLALISFEALGAGSSALAFSDLLFLDSALADIAIDATAGELDVVDVPEPASYLLLFAGLIGAAALRRRQGPAQA